MTSSNNNNKKSSMNYAFWIGMWGLFVLGALASLTATLTRKHRPYAEEPANEWILVGGVTSSSAVFRVYIASVDDGDDDDGDMAPAQLVVSTSTDLIESSPVFVSSDLLARDIGSAYESHGIHKVTVDGGVLQANTVYHYGLVRRRPAQDDNNAQQQPQISLPGRFRTPAPDGTPWNFTIAMAGCAKTGSEAAIFDVLAAHEPPLDLFLHLGDFHYEDIGCNCLPERLEAAHTVLASPPQAALYRSAALAYIWDDHDFLGDGSGSREEEEGARAAALESYDRLFPHHPLAAAAAAAADNEDTDNSQQPQSVSPYHAFTMGTVRFVISDLRSERTDASMYSDEQRQWLQDELSRAAMILSSKPGSDSWSGQPEDRRELSDFITTVIGGSGGSGPQNLIAVAADAHMVAFDDGSNTYFGGNGDDKDGDGKAAADAGEGELSFPILHSGPLDRTGSIKGGPYSHGCHTLRYEHAHQYSTIRFEIPDNSDSNTEGACMQIDSYRVENTEASRELLFSKRLCGKIFVPSAPGRVEGTCEIDPAPVVDRVLFGLSVGGLFLATCVAYYYHRFGRKCFLVCLLAYVSWSVTLVVGIAEILVNGFDSVDAVVIFGILLGQTVLTVGWIGYWGRREALQTCHCECNGETTTTTVTCANSLNNESLGVQNANDSEDVQVNDTERNEISHAERDEEIVVDSQ